MKMYAMSSKMRYATAAWQRTMPNISGTSCGRRADNDQPQLHRTDYKHSLYTQWVQKPMGSFTLWKTKVEKYITIMET